MTSDVVHERVAAALAAAWRDQQLVTVTWVNHFSGQMALDAAPERLAAFDYVGIDGILLQVLLRTPHARLAGGGDATLPLLLPQLHGARVALVGGVPVGTADRTEAVARFLAPDARIVASVDGYDGLPPVESLGAWAAEHRPDVVIVGMGAVLQDTFALDIAQHLRAGVVVTCGGWMDQIAKPSGYYPAWVYQARLNWAVRLAREPKRLWRRYTTVAARALVRRGELRDAITTTVGYQRYVAVVRGETGPGGSAQPGPVDRLGEPTQRRPAS